MLAGVGPIIALALLAQAPSAGMTELCTTARHEYEGLSLQQALGTAEAGLQQAPGALACLEVQALVLLALDRTEDARAALGTLFEIAPEHVVRDDSLSPSTRAFIEQIRAEVRPLSASVTPRWIVRSSLRLDMRLEGGLRGAQRIRYQLQVGPTALEDAGEVQLLGPAATATVHVPVHIEARTLSVSGEVVDQVGRRVTNFSSQLLLPPRPLAAPTAATVSSPESAGGVPWWLWAAAGVVVAAGAVSAGLLLRPDAPSADQTLGRVEL